MAKRKPYESILHRTWPAGAAFLVVTAVGAAGYYWIENRPGGAYWSLADAWYQSVTTLTTVGLSEAHPMGQTGRLFTSLLAIVGVILFTYLGTAIAQHLISGELKGIWGRRRMEQRIRQLSDHFIVCGFGRMGRQVAGDFKRERHPVVVIDKSPEAVQKATELGHLAIEGDAGDDNILKEAGVERARSLITAMDNDADNLMVSLSARGLNDKLFIIARAANEMTESKLIAAGADRVLSPYGISGRRMAQMALRPNVVEFLEVVTHDQELELWLEELKVAFGAPMCEEHIGGAKLREKTGANVVAMRRRTGELLVSPSPDTIIQAGDILIALGTRAQLSALRSLAFGTEDGKPVR